MKKRLNVRLLIRLGVISLAAAVVLQTVHWIQLGRHARSFRAQAEDAADQHDFAHTALYLGRYLSLRPNDIEAEGQYGLALEKLATNTATRWRAYNVLEKVLRRDPDNVPVRQSLAQLAVRLEKFDSAARVLEPLRGTRANLAEVEETLGWCHVAAGNHLEAESCFRESIRRSPHRLTAYDGLVELHLQRNQRPAANRVMNELVEANSRQGAAFVHRARFHERLGQFESAAADFMRAVTIAPEDVKVLLEAADYQRRHGRPDLARSLLQQSLLHRGADVLPVLQLAVLEHDTGRLKEALAVLRGAQPPKEPQVAALLSEFLLEQGQEAESERVANQLPKDSPWTGYTEALRWMHRREWVRAARRMEQLAVDLAQFPGWPERVQLALARCHAACGDVTRQLEASRRSAVPGFRSGQVALAVALACAGRIDEAIGAWKKLMKEAEPPAVGWVSWARAVIRRNAQPSSSTPDWGEIDRLLARAEKAGGDPVEIALARAESLVRRNEPGQAEMLLRSEADRLKHPPLLDAALADVLALSGRFIDALLVLKDHDDVEARLARIRFVTNSREKVPSPADVLAAAQRGLELLPAAESGRILQALIEEAWSRGKATTALELSRRWNNIAADDLIAFLMRFGIAAQSSNDQDMRQAVAGLRRIEGENGLRWRAAEVMRLLMLLRVSRSDAAALAREARRLIAEANQFGRETAAGRGWAALAEGRLEERVGRPVEATAAYLRAFEEGERTESVVQRLLELLFDREQFVEINRVLRLCELEGLTRGVTALREREALYPLPVNSRLLSPTLARLGCEAALRQHDLRRAVELAPRAVPADATHLDLLWLAGVYDRAGKPSDAIMVLEALAERSGDVGEVWVALVRQLIKSGQNEKAQDAVVRAQRALSNGDALWQLPLAQCNEAVGDSKQAERLYQLALQAVPNLPLVRHRIAQFYLTADRPEQALVHLLALTESSSESRSHALWARRALAGIPFQLFVLRREPSNRLREHLGVDDLLAQLPEAKDGKERPGDERLRALVIASQRGHIEEGLKRFEKTLSTKAPLTTDERFRLAQLYDRSGDRVKADDLMRELLLNEDHNPQYVAGKILMLLGRDERTEARPWVRRLQVLEPDAPRTHALRAKCGE